MFLKYPNAGKFRTTRGLFIAAWKVWYKRFSNEPPRWRDGAMPLHAVEQSLAEQLHDGHRFSLDILCRLLVPWNYRNSIQGDNAFVEMNAHILEPVSGYIDATSGKEVPAVRVAEQAMKFWDRRTFVEQDQWMNAAEARIQADIETTSDAAIVVDDAGIDVIGAATYPPQVPDAKASDGAFLDAMIAWIDEDPFQPMYQRRPIGDAVSTWHDRLGAFFWPKPRIGYHEVTYAAGPMLYYSSVLGGRVEAGIEWTPTEKEYAVKVAREVFTLMGTPQREINPETVRAVFEAAINEDENSQAKMNSGWSYLASYATAHLENRLGALPQVGWSSRVAASVISRLDFLLTEAGVEQLGAHFPGLGTIPGWGGTRPREMSLNWPAGYRNWNSHLVGSRLVRHLRDHLNTATDRRGRRKYYTMPLVGGDRGPWTVRGVEMVLFQDGY